MSGIPQEWVQEGTKAALKAWPEEDCPAWQPMAEIVEAVLTAVLPLIREAIARGIEARRQERIASDWASLDESMEDHEAGMEFAFRIAERIARGGAL